MESPSGTGSSLVSTVGLDVRRWGMSLVSVGYIVECDADTLKGDSLVETSRLSRFSTPQLASASATLIGVGIVWVAVVAYRFYAKGISGEWGNIALGSLGLGFGLSLLYCALSSKKSDGVWLGMSVVSTVLIAIALAFGSHAL